MAVYITAKEHAEAALYAHGHTAQMPLWGLLEHYHILPSVELSAEINLKAFLKWFYSRSLGEYSCGKIVFGNLYHDADH